MEILTGVGPITYPWSSNQEVITNQKDPYQRLQALLDKTKRLIVEKQPA
jgi:hypothetical protein